MTPVIHPALRRSLRLAVVAGLAFFSCGITGQRVAAQEQPAGPTVELPKLVVTDQRELPPPESWRYADIPGFEILTNTSDRSTQQLLRNFGLFRQALGMVMPIPTSTSAPTMLILCDRDNKFEEFLPSDTANRVSLFLNNHEQSAIVIRMGTKTLSFTGADNTHDVKIATDSQEFAVDHDQQLYREYVHFLLSRSEARPPAWLEEGLMQIILAMKFDKKSIVFAEVEDPNEKPLFATPEDRDFNTALRHRALVPLQKFFTLSHNSPEALNPLGNNAWAKQAYAFVHMCLYGRGGRYQKPFALFLRRLGKERSCGRHFMTYCFQSAGARNFVRFALSRLLYLVDRYD